MSHGDTVVARPNSEKGLAAEVLTIRELLDTDLRIPDYQRPYKWQVRHVAQLIDDIDTFRHFDQYRVGTVILHKDERGDLNVVDGQQRFLTFCLIADLLERSTPLDVPGVRDKTIPETGADISTANLVDNHAYIHQTLGAKHDREQWGTFFLDSCEVVVLTVDDLDEAFQMFDSQNTRGRALFPTDLLKAFHIREMSSDRTTAALRLEMVRLWEEIPPESINELFSDYLFKIKRWANGHHVPAQGFDSEHIGLFKGIREADPRNRQNRWAMPFLYAKNYTDDYGQENATLVRYDAIPPVEYPFQIDQPVLNGETFFLMVRHYYDLGRRCGLFREVSTGRETDGGRKDPEILPDLVSTLEQLDLHRRKATHRLVRNLFDCLLLYYVDRFGEQDLDRAVLLIARYAMALRVQQKQVRRVMINNYALGRRAPSTLGGTNLFQELREALRAQELLRRPLPTPEPNGYPELYYLFPTVEEGAR